MNLLPGRGTILADCRRPAGLTANMIGDRPRTIGLRRRERTGGFCRRVALAAAAATLLAVAASGQPPAAADATLPAAAGVEAFEALVETGDVLALDFGTAWGVLAERLAPRDRTYGHVGVIVDDDRGGHVLVHASGNPATRGGHVVSEPLTDVLARARRAGLFRLAADRAARGAFAARARAYADRAVPFDRRFCLETADEIYCTELVWRAARDALGIDLAPEKERFAGRTFIPADAIYLSPHLAAVATWTRAAR
jgi:hypothetical protein